MGEWRQAAGLAAKARGNVCATSDRCFMTAAGMRVLVVEDEAFLVMLIEDMLGELGFEIAGMATRVAPALSLVAALEFDLAILDVNLDGRMSFPVADVLDKRGVPYIFATGYGSAGIDAPFKGRTVIKKPFDMDDLQRAIAGVLP